MRYLKLILLLAALWAQADTAGHASDWIQFEAGGNLYVYDSLANAYYFVGPIAKSPVGTPAGDGTNGHGYTWGPAITTPPIGPVLPPHIPPAPSEEDGMNFADYWMWYWYWFGWAAGE